MKVLFFTGLIFVLGACGARNEEAALTFNSGRSFYQWCVDNTVSKEKRKTIEALLSVAARSDCFEANVRLLAQNQVRLWGAVISDLEPVGALQHLESLDLSATHVESLATLPTLPKLRTLSLEGSKIQSIEGIGRFHQLRSLNLSNTRVPSLFGLEGVPRLQSLKLNHSNIVSLEPLRPHRMLENFEMTDCPINIVPQNLDALAANKIVYRRLVIRNCKLNDVSGLRGVKQISLLDLSDNNVTHLDFLDKTAELYQLYASNNEIKSIAVLEKYSKTLSEVHLRKNQIDDVKPLAPLKYLMFQSALSLQENPVRKDSCPTDSANTPLNQFCTALQGVP